MRRCLLSLALFLGLAAPAHAATVSVEGDVLRVSAQPGEANAFQVYEEDFALVPGSLGVVDEYGNPVEPGPGCAPRGRADDLRPRLARGGGRR